MKLCSKCSEQKLLVEFRTDKRKRDGHGQPCLACIREYNHQIKAADPQRVSAAMRARSSKHYQSNKESLLVAHAAYHALHREQENARSRKWRQTHPERVRQQQATWRQRNPEADVIIRRSKDRVRYALRTGRLVRPDVCQECGHTGKKITAAHSDYSQPLLVRWLCYACHNTWDRSAPKLIGTLVLRSAEATP